VAVFIAAGQAEATLGESAASVESDRRALSAAQRSLEVRDGYTVQELRSDAVDIREYVSPSGVVFGIAWNGLTHPDLTQLLGSYSSEFQNAMKKTPRTPGHRRLQVKTDRIVVERWGHMRDLRGRAYIPALIPPGVDVDGIK